MEVDSDNESPSGSASGVLGKVKYHTYLASRYINAALSALVISVADPGFLSWIPDPDFYLSRISDPGSKSSYKR